MSFIYYYLFVSVDNCLEENWMGSPRFGNFQNVKHFICFFYSQVIAAVHHLDSECSTTQADTSDQKCHVKF